MRKILFSLVVLIGICTLVACRLVDNKTIEFHDQSFNQFTYKGNDYTIMNQIVDENDLGTVKESFFKTLVIDRNFSDGLAISINDSYYKVSLSSDVQSNNEMLSLEEFNNNSAGGELAIDPSDCRIVKFNNKKFRISSDIVSDDKLKEFLGVIADSKTFILNTGPEISKSELNKIDYSGSNSNEKREVWDYGEVYLLAEEGTIAVEINNEFRIARIE